VTVADLSQPWLVPHDDASRAQVVCVTHRPSVDDVFDTDRNIFDGSDDGLADALDPPFSSDRR